MRILHTADWQLGLKLRFLTPEVAARMRAQRFDTVREIARLAQDRNVDVVVVAGDVFDDNAVGADTLQQAHDALTAFGQVPVVLLPGNHDPATADSALERLQPPAPVIVATARDPITLKEATVYPCPLTRRHEYEDPTEWLPSRKSDEGIRIAVAHGCALDFSEGTDTPNHIHVAAVIDKGFDYLAMGDWHGRFQLDDRAWYSGTPEATRFKEREPGCVLVVDIEAPGVKPRVEPVRINRSHWVRHDVEFHEDVQVDELNAWLNDLPERSRHLVELSLTGQLSIAARARLDDLLEEYAKRLAHLCVADDQVQAEPWPDDLGRLSCEGFVGAAVAILKEGKQPPDYDALRLLYRLMQEARR